MLHIYITPSTIEEVQNSPFVAYRPISETGANRPEYSLYNHELDARLAAGSEDSTLDA